MLMHHDADEVYIDIPACIEQQNLKPLLEAKENHLKKKSIFFSDLHHCNNPCIIFVELVEQFL
jgi:hypothetical protein